MDSKTVNEHVLSVGDIEEAIRQNQKMILTFGGAFSNHIAAVATAGKENGLKTIGIIRGEEHLPLNPTLQFAKDQGMAFHYMDRSRYREKTSEKVIDDLKDQFGEFYLIPEGGTNELAIKGTEEIINLIDIDYDNVCWYPNSLLYILWYYRNCYNDFYYLLCLEMDGK